MGRNVLDYPLDVAESLLHPFELCFAVWLCFVNELVQLQVKLAQSPGVGWFIIVGNSIFVGEVLGLLNSNFTVVIEHRVTLDFW